MMSEWQYPLCTLLVFDSRQHALPVAWVITRSIAKPDVSKWMKALLNRVRAVDPGWRINGFLIDDAAAETDPIRHCGLTTFILFLNLSNIPIQRIYVVIGLPGIHFLVLSYFHSGVFVDHGCGTLSRDAVTLKFSERFLNALGK